MIPEKQYINIIENIPILCVDLVITNPKKEYLLVKRTNEPLKGKWWVVGGRVLKGETIANAAVRKAKEELAIEIDKSDPIGYFEAPFQKHPFGLKISYHAVSIVYSVEIDYDQEIKLDSQSSKWKFCKKLPDEFIINRFTD